MNYNQYPSKGIDNKIKIIQNILATNLCLKDVNYYGRVIKSISKDGKSLIPEVYTSNSERKEVYYDDITAAGGNVFFIESDDEHKTKDGKLFTAKIKIVFMLNLEKQIPGKSYRVDSEIHDKCMKLIQKSKAIEITGLEKGIKNVFKDFDTTRIKLSDTSPYHIFSINGDLKYQFNCNQ
jgi:hypothetical protein